MKQNSLVKIVILLCLSLLLIGTGAMAQEWTVKGLETIQPSNQFVLEYNGLNVSDKLVWDWTSSDLSLNFWLEGPDGGVDYYSLEGKTSDSSTYAIPIKGLWKLIWDNENAPDASEDYSVVLTYNVTLIPRNLAPTATITAQPTSGNAPLSVVFGGGGSDVDGTIKLYSWDFGDGGTSAEQNPTHTYETPGTYTATLIVTDDDGDTGSETIVITVSTAPPLPATSVELMLGTFEWADGPIKAAEVLLTGNTRSTYLIKTGNEGVADFEDPVKFGTYNYRVTKTMGIKSATIFQGTIVINEDTPANTVWFMPGKEDEIISSLTEGEFDVLVGFAPPSEESEQTFQEDETKEVIVGEEEVEVTVTESSEETIVVDIGEETDVSLPKNEPVEVDTDGDGKEDLELIYQGLDENKNPEISFNKIESEASGGFNYVPVIIVILVVLVIIVLFFVVRAHKASTDEFYEEEVHDETSEVPYDEPVQEENGLQGENGGASTTNTCNICLKLVESDRYMVECDCGSLYHGGCIEGASGCPTCGTPVSEVELSGDGDSEYLELGLSSEFDDDESDYTEDSYEEYMVEETEATTEDIIDEKTEGATGEENVLSLEVLEEKEVVLEG